MDLNAQEENRLMLLLQLDDASFERLLLLAERKHDPNNLINHAEITSRIKTAIEARGMTGKVVWQYTLGGTAFVKDEGRGPTEITVPVLQLFLGMRSPILTPLSWTDGYIWFIATVETRPEPGTLEKAISTGIEDIMARRSAMLNGGAGRKQ